MENIRIKMTMANGNTVYATKKQYTHICWLRKWANDKGYSLKVYGKGETITRLEVYDGETLILAGTLKEVWQKTKAERNALFNPRIRKKNKEKARQEQYERDIKSHLTEIEYEQLEELRTYSRHRKYKLKAFLDDTGVQFSLICGKRGYVFGNKASGVSIAEIWAGTEQDREAWRKERAEIQRKRKERKEVEKQKKQLTTSEAPKDNAEG